MHVFLTLLSWYFLALINTENLWATEDVICWDGVVLLSFSLKAILRQVHWNFPQMFRPSLYPLLWGKVSHSNMINLQREKIFSICLQLIVFIVQHLQSASPSPPLLLLKKVIVQDCACQNISKKIKLQKYRCCGGLEHCSFKLYKWLKVKNILWLLCIFTFFWDDLSRP